MFSTNYMHDQFMVNRNGFQLKSFEQSKFEYYNGVN